MFCESFLHYQAVVICDIYIYIYIYIILIARVRVQYGKIFYEHAKYFHEPKASENVAESKISFPYCTTSVIIDLLLL